MSKQDFVYSPPKEPFLNILYKDEHIAVIDKPSGLLSVPGRQPEAYDSVLARLKTLNPEAGAVHRLDMDTSGLMVVGFGKKAIADLGVQFEKKQVKKFYLAKVAGVIEYRGEVLLPIRCDWERRPLQIVDFRQGKKSHTSYFPLKIYKNESVVCPSSTLVCLIPLTGRSHQLRVHLAGIGHPILGDRFYAGKDLQDENSGVLALHSAFLAFTHPKTKKTMQFLSPAAFAEKALLDKAVSEFLTSSSC